MNAFDLAHRFFNEPESRGSYANVNVHFNNYNDGTRDFYSYSTPIAEIRPDKNGVYVCLVSDHTYSTTTSRHISMIERAANIDVITVPVVSCSGNWYRYGARYYGFRDKVEYIQELTTKELQKESERRKVRHYFALYRKYTERFSDLPKDIVKMWKSAKVKKQLQLCDEIDAARAAAKLRTAQRSPELVEAERAKREAAKQRRINNFLNGYDVLEKVKTAFDLSSRKMWSSRISDFDRAVREYRRNLDYMRTSDGRRFSYMWDDGDTVRTSQHVSVNAREIAVLLKLWKSGRDILGLKAGIYTIVEKTPEYVKCGCHIIPVWNIEAMYNKLCAA